jgi:hypothetical protein
MSCSTGDGLDQNGESMGLRGELNNRRPDNNGLHQTGRGGVAVPSPRPVVEARPAGEAGCYACASAKGVLWIR